MGAGRGGGAGWEGRGGGGLEGGETGREVERSIDDRWVSCFPTYLEKVEYELRGTSKIKVLLFTNEKFAYT